MIVPGSNLLNVALGVVGAQSVLWYHNIGRETNPLGYDIPVFLPGKVIHGSFQPMDRDTVQRLGFDLQKNYATFYTSEKITILGRDTAGDEFGFNGSRWTAAGDGDWSGVDGWDGIVLVRIGGDVG